MSCKSDAHEALTLPRFAQNYRYVETSMDLVEVDPRQHYIYGCPREYSNDPRYDRAHQKRLQIWPTLQYFDPEKILFDIRNYINMWQLGPKFGAVIVALEERKPEKFGTCHFVDVFFTKPTDDGQNPNINAVVHFHIYVSRLLPKYYPIMVTYRFEDEEKEHYTLGIFQETDMKFQATLIEKIIESKAPNPLLSDTSLSGNDESDDCSIISMETYRMGVGKSPDAPHTILFGKHNFFSEFETELQKIPLKKATKMTHSRPTLPAMEPGQIRTFDEQGQASNRICRLDQLKDANASMPFNLSYYTGSAKCSSRSTTSTSTSTSLSLSLLKSRKSAGDGVNLSSYLSIHTRDSAKSKNLKPISLKRTSDANSSTARLQSQIDQASPRPTNCDSSRLGPGPGRGSVSGSGSSKDEHASRTR